MSDNPMIFRAWRQNHAYCKRSIPRTFMPTNLIPHACMLAKGCYSAKIKSAKTFLKVYPQHYIAAISIYGIKWGFKVTLHSPTWQFLGFTEFTKTTRHIKPTHPSKQAGRWRSPVSYKKLDSIRYAAMLEFLIVAAQYPALFYRWHIHVRTVTTDFECTLSSHWHHFLHSYANARLRDVEMP